jgi:leucyl-tRNA synthetase
VNGKTRGTLGFKKGALQEEVERAVRADPRVDAYLHGTKTVRVIFVPDRLINFVIQE